MAQGLPTLLDIDFLPAAYRQRSMQRRAYAWRVAAAAMVLGFLTVAGLFQWRQQSQVARELEQVEAQYADAVEMNARFAEAAKELQDQHKWAELLTFLRHRWPRSQIMAAILEPLPDSVVLNEWHIGHEAVVVTGTTQPAPPSETKTAPVGKAAYRAADLKRLMQENALRLHFVSLTGDAGDASTLHEYLARLGTNPLFASVDLRSLENVAGDKSAGAAQGTVHFTARAVLRAGHGQPQETKPALPAEGSASPLAHQGAGS